MKMGYVVSLSILEKLQLSQSIVIIWYTQNMLDISHFKLQLKHSLFVSKNFSFVHEMNKCFNLLIERQLALMSQVREIFWC